MIYDLFRKSANVNASLFSTDSLDVNTIFRYSSHIGTHGSEVHQSDWRFHTGLCKISAKHFDEYLKTFFISYNITIS